MASQSSACLCNNCQHERIVGIVYHHSATYTAEERKMFPQQVRAHNYRLFKNKNLYRWQTYDNPYGVVHGGITQLMDYKLDSKGRHVPHGLYTTCFPGSINTSCQYKNGKRHGLYTERWPSTQVKCERHYVNGKLHGRYVEYDEEGNIIIDVNYKHDKRC